MLSFAIASPFVPSSNILNDWNFELYSLVVAIISTYDSLVTFAVTIPPLTSTLKMLGGLAEISG